MIQRFVTGLVTLVAGGLRRVLRDRRGVGAVEFAILLPFLMMLLFAIIEFGFIMHTRQNML